MRAFFAYPGSNPQVVQEIKAACEVLGKTYRETKIVPWEENDISGRLLTDPIFEGIASSDALFADVTEMNFNVTFEIGYAIGSGRRVYLTRNKNFSRDTALTDKIGIFDTLGFDTYSDYVGLSALIKSCDGSEGIKLKATLNHKAPVYLLQTPQTNASMLAIMSRIKKARLGFKGYIPADESRLSAVKAVDDISACIGAIVPLLPATFSDAPVHNIRAAFISGLALGMNKTVLILQPRGGPAPLDVRDLVKTFEDQAGIVESISIFALDVYEKLQADDPLPLPAGNFLTELSIGDAVAENEFQTLGRYYIRTDQYKRASRGEVNLVVGRKGAGKTALFSQLRNEKRNNVANIVVDLKPEGYQLIRLKEDVLDFLAEGARTHLVTALFEYVLYMEVCYKLLEKDRDRHVRDARLFGPYRRLQEIYDMSVLAGEGDFSERLQGVSRALVATFRERYGSDTEQRLTSNQVTELVHKQNIKEIRQAISEYLAFKNETWILFDNLDKGWSSHGITYEDVMILRCLIDAARKIQHQMQSHEHDFHCVVFVRNDVYQNLVEASADYGKESRAVLDWTDPERLRELIRLRIVSNALPSDTPFGKIWARLCVTHFQGEETSQYLIDRSLMRPRNLIKLVAHCRGFAVGVGHDKIEESDLEKGLRAYSLDLITEADQELTDILGEETNLIYYFIGEGEKFDLETLKRLISMGGVPDKMLDAVIRFMLYYGFLGIMGNEGAGKYIYDVGYDMKLLEILAKKAGNNITYVLNPAFYPALNL